MKSLKFGLLISIIFCLQSCLTDPGLENALTASLPTVGFLNGTPDTTAFPTIAPPSTAPYTVTDVKIKLDSTFSSDVTVNISENPGLLSTGMTPLPAGSISIPTSVIIPAGSLSVSVPIILTNTSLLTLGTVYGYGLTINSVSTGVVNIDAKHLLVRLKIRNKYEGVYNVTGTFSDIINPSFTNSYPLTYHVVTTGPSTLDVKIFINGEYIPGYLFNTGTGGGAFYGSFGLTITFNPNTDVIADLYNYYGDPTKPATSVGNPALGTGPPLFMASNTRRATLDPTGVNAYDAAGSIIRIKYFMIQPSMPTGTNPRSFFDETWTYVGPLP